MVLKLHGNPNSTCTKRAQVVFIELGIPYELVPVDYSTHENKMPEYVVIHPFGRVPYLDDDGFTIYESRAIARYIALKYGGIGKLIPDPRDLRKTALFEQAASIETTSFDAQAFELLYQLVFNP